MLFKKAGKLYQKGTYCYKFIDYLDIDLICKNIQSELNKLERELFPNKKTHILWKNNHEKRIIFGI